MKFKSLTKLKWLGLLILVPEISQAFTVDSLIKFSSDQDYFLVTGNDEKRREYINVTLSELVTQPGHVAKETNYTAENIVQWPIVAEPTEIVVDSGEQVKVRLVENYTPSGGDRVFGITFTPDNVSHNQGKSYDLTFGYKTWYIIPGRQPMMGSLEMSKQKKVGDYLVHNQTNKAVVVKLDYCNEKLGIKESCLAELIVAPYTNKSVSLGERAAHIEAKFHVGGNKSKDSVKTITF